MPKWILYRNSSPGPACLSDYAHKEYIAYDAPIPTAQAQSIQSISDLQTTMKKRESRLLNAE